MTLIQASIYITNIINNCYGNIFSSISFRYMASRMILSVNKNLFGTLALFFIIVNTKKPTYSINVGEYSFYNQDLK